jgi:hypothetical protein
MASYSKIHSYFLKEYILKLNKGKPDDRIATAKKTKELYEFYSEKFYESITKFGISQNESFTLF